ncbi:fungal-specific transcription factor domain-containing protein [Dissophora ornata]|nr:fungal-specific transcription factor domain-containing protein [Dissophora ornata]
MSPASRRSESRAGPSPSSIQRQGSSNSNHNSINSSNDGNNIDGNNNNNSNTSSANPNNASNPSNAVNTNSMAPGANASDNSLTGLVSRLNEKYPAYPTYPPAASFTSSASANSSPSPNSSPLISPLPQPHHNPRYYFHPNHHPRQHQHAHPSSLAPGSRSHTLSSRHQTLDVGQNQNQNQSQNQNQIQSQDHNQEHNQNEGQRQRQRQSPNGSRGGRHTPKHQKKTNKSSGNNNSKRDSNTNRQFHSQPNRGTSSRHPTANNQGGGVNDGQAPSSTNSTAFASSDAASSVGAADPCWPEYQQSSHPHALPLNCYASSSQHHQHVTGMAPLDHRAPIAAPVPAPVESPRIAPPKQLNQNQVHAQTHPWRIKVYSACLACRKKKIKCDGQPTCQRCARLGFECSYIEVPHTPQARSAKQKQKSSAVDASDTSLNSNTAKTVTSKGHGHPARDQPLVQHHQESNNAVEAAKEIRQQRRSSTKDAAGGSFLHSTSRRTKELVPPKDPVGDRPLPAVGPTSPVPRKDLRPSDVTGQPGPRPMSAFVMDRDTIMPDLYHILVNSVTIPNVSKYSQSTPQGSSPTTGQGGGGVLMGMDQLNLTLASPAIPTFTVLNSDHTDPDQHHSSFQNDPSSNSFLDRSIPVGFVITNKSVIQYLVHVYFECFHFHWMIVDKENFLAQLKDPSAPPDPLLLVAICAAGAKYSDHEGLCAEPGNLATIGEQFLTHARILLQDRFDLPSMSTLQALLILYWCQIQTGRASLRFMYAGMAIRMAQEMGLNRPIDAKRLKDMDEREVQIRKTIWWSCYQADRWTSAALGKPMVISDIDCLVDYPVSLNESERFHVQSFQHMTNLAKILGKVILNLYTSTNAATCSSAVFQHLDQSLSSWIESMPSTLSESENVLPTPMSLESVGGALSSRSSSSQRGKSSTSSKSATPALEESMMGTGSAAKVEPSAVAYYALLFHTVRIMLYRPFLHNSALAPVLPLTMQSPLSRCRESAVAISEIAENMVTEQRSYRQLFNSIHISLCAAATIHRFVIASPKIASQHKDMDSMDSRSRDEPLTVGTVTVSTSTPPTLSKAPSHAKTDLYYLTVLLRILQNCSRFSIEKNLLRNIIDGYLTQKHMSPQDLAWAREEIHKPFTIVPFAVKMPMQSSAGSRSMVALNLSSTSSPASNSQGQAQQQARPPSAMQQSIDLSTPQEAASTPQTQAQQQHQNQQYQLQMRQQQHEQQRAKQQARTRRLNASTGDMISSSANHNLPLGTYTPGTVSTDDSCQMRSASRTSSMSGPSEYVATVAPGTFSSQTVAEQQQLQQYQRELDLLQQQHRIQQSELTQHHQRQALQLEQAQMYQQHQQNQEYMRQSQQQQAMFSQQQQQPNNTGSSQQSGSLYSRSRPSSTGMLSPQAPFSSQPNHAVARNKCQSEASLKKKQSKQRQHDSKQDQRQQQEDHQKCQERQQQQIQGYSQTDSYMANAAPPEVDQNMALGSLSGMARSDEMMTSNSAPSGNETSS